MKTRNGFVSNSSSASFIIDNSNIKEVAQYMLNVIIEEWIDEDIREPNKQTIKMYEKWKKNLEASLLRKDIQTGNMGITIPSCNYDTYIIEKNGKTYISTCNNHYWNFNEENIGLPISYSDGADGDGDIHQVVVHNKFFNIRNRLIHNYPEWENDTTLINDMNFDKQKKECPSCKNYYGNYVIANNKKICAQCYKGIIGTKECLDLPYEAF